MADPDPIGKLSPTEAPATVYAHTSNIAEIHPDRRPTASDDGIITRNPFFNYLRHFRQHTPLRRSREIVRAAATAWKALSYAQKMPFVLLAKREQRKRRREQKSPVLTLAARSRPRNFRRSGLLEWHDVMYIN